MNLPSVSLPRVGVAVLILNAAKHILLGHRQGGRGAGTWGLPGGMLEFGETFEVCAQRETQEETGLAINPPRLVTALNSFFPAMSEHFVTIFMKTQYTQNQEPQRMEPEKCLEWRWFDRQQLPEKLFCPLPSLFKIIRLYWIKKYNCLENRAGDHHHPDSQGFERALQ